jgi:hypothetical protein
MTESRPWTYRFIRPLAILLALILFIVIFSIIVGVRPNDYMSFMRPPTIKWLKGETSIFDSNAHGFYFMPWSLLLFIPTVWVPPAIGQGMLSVLTLIGVIMALKVFGEGVPLWLKSLASIPFCLFILIISGNLDGVVLLGFCLSIWAIKSHQPFLLATGLWLATLKPINILPLLIFVFVLTWGWSWKDKLKGFSFLLLSIIVSFPLFGWDWPLRYYSNITSTPPLDFPIVTLWKFGSQFNVPLLLLLAISVLIIGISAIHLISNGFNMVTFSMTTAAWMFITPYALIIHYVLLMPAFLITARYLKGLSVLFFLASYLPLLRVPFGYDIIYIDLLYPLLLWMSAIHILRFRKQIPEHQIIQSTNSHE